MEFARAAPLWRSRLRAPAVQSRRPHRHDSESAQTFRNGGRSRGRAVVSATAILAAFTGPQLRALRELIALRCDLDDLKMICREDLGKRLNTWVNEAKGFDVVVFDLIDRLEQEELLGTFVAAVAARKINFARELEAIVAGAVPTPFMSKNKAEVHRFSDEFTQRRVWFQYLNVYKELHELLHNLDSFMAQLEEEAGNRANEGFPISEATAADLRQWVEGARTWVAQAEPCGPPLSVLVRDFSQAVEEFLGTDATSHADALASLARLPGQQLSYLNSRLVGCARELKVDDLIKLLDQLPIPALGL